MSNTAPDCDFRHDKAHAEHVDKLEKKWDGPGLQVTALGQH